MAAIVCVGGGCYRGASVDVQTLARTSRRAQADPSVVEARGRMVRWTPNSYVRLGDGAGRWTRALRAGDLRVNARGVFARDRAPISMATRIVATGLGHVEVAALRATRPHTARLILRSPGVYELEADTGDVRRWLGDFVNAAVEAYLAPLYHGQVRRRAVATPAQRVYQRKMARNMLLGSWTFELGALRSKRVSTRWLSRILARGVPAWVGWSWAAVRDARVYDLASGETVAWTLGVPAAIVTMFSGGLHVLSQTLPPRRPAPARLSPDVIGTADSDARHAFSGRARRRSIATLIADVQTTSDVRGAWKVAAASAGVRLGDLLDVQLGYRRVLRPHTSAATLALTAGDSDDSPVDSTSATSSHLVLRLGYHLPLDAHQRWFVPIALDLGGYFRATLGLRLRLTNAAYLGAYAFNPTYLPDTSGDGGRWSWQSGLELGLSY